MMEFRSKICARKRNVEVAAQLVGRSDVCSTKGKLESLCRILHNKSMANNASRDLVIHAIRMKRTKFCLPMCV